MNRVFLRIVAGLLVVLPLILHSLGIAELRWLDELENRLYDSRLRLTAPTGVDPRVVVVDIDEKSLRELGQWPWKRDVLARLVERLFEDHHIAVLGMDSVFAEPDSDPTLESLRTLSSRDNLVLPPEVEELAARQDRDRLFADVLSRYPVVMGYTFGNDPEQRSVGLLPSPLFDRDSEPAQTTQAPEASRYTANLPLLQGSRPGGFFSLLEGVDSDGIIRRVPLLNRYDGALYPALALVTAAAWLGVDIAPVSERHGNDDQALLDILDFGTHRISLDRQTAVYVPYRESPGLFRYLSAVDVIRGEVPASAGLSGMVAMLGTSAAGLVDNRATPVHQVFPGVEIHASLVAGLMDGGLRAHPGWARGAERLLLGGTALLLVLLLPYLGAIAMTLVAFAVGCIHIAANMVLWTRHDFIVALAPVLAATALVYLVNLVLGYLGESRSRRQLKQSFGMYVPPEIIDRMQGQGADALLRSEKREMTVLFTDIRGFTGISEGMAPEDISQMMNAFLTPMTAVVHRHGGAIDKYMGDAMMAFWGAPMEDPDHAVHATHAALEMIEALRSVNSDFAARGWPPVHIGIGLSTGMMSVGNMGSTFRMAYTVLGDAVNLGSRLEGLTAKYAVPILMSDATARHCNDLELLPLDRVRVKGRTEPVRIHTVLGRRGAVTDARLRRAERFSRGLDQLLERRWEAALETFRAVETECLTGDTEAGSMEAGLYGVFRARAESNLASPPGPQWDGVVNFQEK